MSLSREEGLNRAKTSSLKKSRVKLSLEVLEKLTMVLVALLLVGSFRTRDHTQVLYTGR